MSNGFDIYTIILLGLAIFVLFRLRSVLGTRTGHERPPYDPYSRREQQGGEAGENVVTLPNRSPDAQSRLENEPPVLAPDRWRGIAGETAAESGLDAIKSADPSFDGKIFLQGARAAYEMIVTAFARGDRKALQPLLAHDVFEGFAEAIAEREKRGETVETTFVSIDKAEVIDAELNNGMANVTVRFVSQLVTVTRGKDGAIVDGSSEAVSEVMDVWTFSRDTRTSDPNWKLVATESAD